MSKETRQFLEQLKRGEESTFVESIKDAASSVKDVGGQVWDDLKPMFDHGRTELAAALFSGQAHVMYMKGQQSVEEERDQGKEMSEDQRDRGREL